MYTIFLVELTSLHREWQNWEEFTRWMLGGFTTQANRKIDKTRKNRPENGEIDSFHLFLRHLLFTSLIMFSRVAARTARGIPVAQQLIRSSVVARGMLYCL